MFASVLALSLSSATLPQSTLAACLPQSTLAAGACKCGAFCPLGGGCGVNCPCPAPAVYLGPFWDARAGRAWSWSSSAKTGFYWHDAVPVAVPAFQPASMFGGVCVGGRCR